MQKTPDMTKSIRSAAAAILLLSVLFLDAAGGEALPIRKVFSRKTPADTLELPIAEDGCVHFDIACGGLARGTVVDFNATVNPTAGCSRYYILEYLDGKKWIARDSVMFFFADKPAERQPVTMMQTFRIRKTSRHGLRIRLRPVGNETAGASRAGSGGTGSDGTASGGTRAGGTASGASMSLAKYGYTGEYIQNFGKGTAKDTTDILCIGNSFTYVGASHFFLKEIAWNEGHLLRIKASLKGGQSFGQHLKLPLTAFAVEAGNYDCALLQNQSQAAARYACDSTAWSQINEDFLKLAGNVFAYSPECRIVLESTWAFKAGNFGGFGSFEEFDALLKRGSEHMLRNARAAYPHDMFTLSPIGKAFEKVRDGDSGINLYDADNKHQSIYGAYLKACVNYLVIFGEGFHSGTDRQGSTIDCGLPHDKAAYLRHIAEETVLPSCRE